MKPLSLHDWVEDLKKPEGDLLYVCPPCGEMFTGNSDRVVCKVCDKEKHEKP